MATSAAITKTLTRIGKKRAKLEADQAALKVEAAAAIQEARAAGFEAAQIVEITGWSRSWLYRDFKAAMGRQPKSK